MSEYPQPKNLYRLEDRRFLTGSGTFCADLNMENQLYAVMVRSDHAHANLKKIDLAAACSIPGVLGVFTDEHLAQDNLRPLPCSAQLDAISPLIVPPRRALARGRVRHVGDILAFVVAESPSIANDASELVEVDLEPLKTVIDPRRALDGDAPIIWPDTSENLAFRFQAGDFTSTQSAIENATHLVEVKLINNRISAVPIEPRAGIGEYDINTGRFTLTFTGQGLHSIKAELAHVFDLPLDSFHLKAPDVGGGFGLKNFIYPEWVLITWAAKQLGRPVKWVAERGEDVHVIQQLRAVHNRHVRAADRALEMQARG